MRDRLIELLSKTLDRTCGVRSCAANVETNDSGCLGCLADELLANGVIVPPVKVGDVVYSIKRTYSKCRLDSYWDDIRCQGCELECDSHTSYDIQDEQVAAIEWDGYRFSVRTNKYSPKPKAIGEPIYGVLLTREQAEQALKGGEQE